MTDAVTIRVVEGETGPRLVFTRPVEFVEVPYDSVPELIKELVLELVARSAGWPYRVEEAEPETPAWAKKPLSEAMKKTKNNPMMDPDEVNEWATTPELRDFETFLKAEGFRQYPGRLSSTSQHGEGYLTWCNGTLSESKTVVRWHQDMMEGLHEFFRWEKARAGYNGIVWRKCPSFEMQDGFGRVLRMRFHLIHVTNT